MSGDGGKKAGSYDCVEGLTSGRYTMNRVLL